MTRREKLLISIRRWRGNSGWIGRPMGGNFEWGKPAMKNHQATCCTVEDCETCLYSCFLQDGRRVIVLNWFSFSFESIAHDSPSRIGKSLITRPGDNASYKYSETNKSYEYIGGESTP